MMDINTIITRTDYIIKYTSPEDYLTKLTETLGKPFISLTYNSNPCTGIDLGNNIAIVLRSANGDIYCGTFNPDTWVFDSRESLTVLSTTGGTFGLVKYSSNKMVIYSGNIGTAVFVNYHLDKWGLINFYGSSVYRLNVAGVSYNLSNLTIKDDLRNAYLIPHTVDTVCDNLFAISPSIAFPVGLAFPLFFEVEGIPMGMKGNMAFCL